MSEHFAIEYISDTHAQDWLFFGAYMLLKALIRFIKDHFVKRLLFLPILLILVILIPVEYVGAAIIGSVTILLLILNYPTIGFMCWILFGGKGVAAYASILDCLIEVFELE